MTDFIDTLTFLDDAQRGALRKQDLTAVEDFTHITVARLEAAPFSLSTGKASKLLRAAGVAGSTATNVTVTHAERPSYGDRIDKALAAAREDVSKADALVELGVDLVVLAANDRIDVEATKAMRRHIASGAPAGATWQGQRLAETATLSTPPIWCSPRTQLPLQAGKDEITEVPWGELKLDGLRDAAFGYREGMFVGMPDEAVFKRIKEDEFGIRAKIAARMKATGTKPEAMDTIVVFQQRIPSRGRDAIVRAVPLGRVGTGTLVSNLAALLLSLFAADELRRFLRYLPDGDAILAALPGANAAPATLAAEAVAYLQRQGLIRRELRDALIAERPRKVDDIERVFSAAGI